MALQRKIQPLRQTSQVKRWGTKEFSVSIDDSTGVLLGKAFDKAYPGIVEEIEAATKQVYDISYDNWPERTGFSKSQLSYEMLFSENSIEGKVYAKADYSKYIHKPKPTPNIYVWQEYMIKPQKALIKPLVESLTKRIPEDIGG